MLKYFKLKISILTILLVPGYIHASDYVPDVYQDEYIIVRSGIAEAGRKPVHFGDRLSLIIEAEFSGDEVIIENLDEQLFERSWGSEKGISLIGSPELVRIEHTDGRSVYRSTFYFQILDCPGELTSCRGNKEYELPIFTIGYQIIDASGSVVNNKSVRFNPVPGYVSVIQALDIRGEGGLEKLSAYIGSSGYPAAMTVMGSESGSFQTLLTGGIIFLLGFFPLLLSKGKSGRMDDPRSIKHRWERVLVHIKDGDDLSNEEWSDLLRRSVTWYCMDELGVNPYSWLSDGNSHGVGPGNSKFRDYFIDVLNQEGVDTEQRSEYINRFIELVNSPAGQMKVEANS